jgi:hypothetical protein
MQKVAYMTRARRFCIQIQILFAKVEIVWIIFIFFISLDFFNKGYSVSGFLFTGVSDLGVIAREIYGDA